MPYFEFEVHALKYVSLRLLNHLVAVQLPLHLIEDQKRRKTHRDYKLIYKVS